MHPTEILEIEVRDHSRRQVHCESCRLKNLIWLRLLAFGLTIGLVLLGDQKAGDGSTQGNISKQPGTTPVCPEIAPEKEHHPDASQAPSLPSSVIVLHYHDQVTMNVRESPNSISANNVVAHVRRGSSVHVEGAICSPEGYLWYETRPSCAGEGRACKSAVHFLISSLQTDHPARCP
jgi:hypothetical protein